MAVSRNGFFLFKKVLFLALTKFTCYAELGVVRARKSRNTNLYNNIHVIDDAMKSRVLYCTGLRHDGIIFQMTLRKT
jgi:hypothetical protein